MRKTSLCLLSLALGSLGCPERGRIGGPTDGIGLGPEVTITNPSQDVSLTAGTSILLKGTVFDEEGVDTVFFTNLSAPGTLPPQAAGGAVRTSFSIPVDLIGAAGDTVLISVYAANLQHVRGDLVTRRIRLN